MRTVLMLSESDPAQALCDLAAAGHLQPAKLRHGRGRSGGRADEDMPHHPARGGHIRLPTLHPNKPHSGSVFQGENNAEQCENHSVEQCLRAKAPYMHFMRTSLTQAQCFEKDELNQALGQCLHDPGAVLTRCASSLGTSRACTRVLLMWKNPALCPSQNGSSMDVPCCPSCCQAIRFHCAFTLPQDPFRLDEYLTANPFLPDINNEGTSKNATYADNLASLKRLVLYRFEDEYTVVPRGRHAFLIFNKITDLPLALTCSKPSAQPDGGWNGHIWCHI